MGGFGANRRHGGWTIASGVSRVATLRIEHLDDLVTAAQGMGRVPIAVAGAEDSEVLVAVGAAARKGIVVPFLVGNAGRIAAIAEKVGVSLAEIHADIVDVPEGEDESREAAGRAVELVHLGRAAVLVKGRLDTSELMHAVLDRNAGLRTGRLLTHVGLFETPGLDRILYISDGGVVLQPDLHQKMEIVRNAVGVAHALGLAEPKVAILAVTEKVSGEMPTAMEAAALSKMADRGQIQGAVIDGPLGLDNAVSMEAASRKGIGGPVAGKADILIVPNAEAGNLMAKVITFLAGGSMAGVVVGAKVPIVITSRADSSRSKLLSIALGVVLGAGVIEAERVTSGNGSAEKAASGAGQKSERLADELFSRFRLLG